MQMKLITKRIIYADGTVPATAAVRRLSPVVTAAMATLVCLSAAAWYGPGGTDDYMKTNLISDQAGVALLQDTNLVNAWGISFSATSPFWVSDNGSSLATVYAVTYDTNGVVHVAKCDLRQAGCGKARRCCRHGTRFD
jgi:hypothetical protein